MTNRVVLPLVVVAALGLGACTSDGEERSEATVRRVEDGGGGGGGIRPGVVRALQVGLSCDQVLDHLQAEALDRVTAWGLNGDPRYGEVWEDGGPATMAAESTVTAAADMAASPSSAPQASGTNTQVAGVDEGDVVETDGRYLYAVTDGLLRIIDPQAGREVGRLDLPLDAWNRQILLADGHLAVVDATWAGDDSASVLTDVDVTDPTSPRIASRTRLEGELVATRAVGSQARVVVRSALGANLPFVQPGRGTDDSEREALRRNREVIEESTIEDWLPRVVSVQGDGFTAAPRPALDCADVAIPSIDAGFGLAWVATGQIGGPDPLSGAVGVVASGETVMATAESIYVATIHRSDEGGDVVPVDPEPLTTELHRFSIDSAGAGVYEASGEVPGMLLNQFSMDEHEGVLRVAVTGDGSDFESPQASSVHTFRQSGDELVELGGVTGLGVTEQIYAVRFLGDLGYVVTFRQVDPLYVIDLSDPATPRLAGEVKVPGYSAYLHPVGEGMLLGIGQDADANGTTRGTKLSLFDVSDSSAPAEVATLPIGTWSEIEGDHHAFTMWGDTAFIPTAAWLTEPGGGVIVADVVDGTLVERGRVVQHRDVSYFGEDPVRRSVVVGDRLLTVSGYGVQVSELDTLAPVTWIAFK